MEHVGQDGRTYRSLRFTAYGKRRYVSLGPVSAVEATKHLGHVLADVERGTWQPAAPIEPPGEPDPMPTFHVFAEEWWLRNEKQLRPTTQADYRWRLEKHLLPFFAAAPLNQITFDLVERYIAAKLAEDEPLSARSINMTLVLMGSILEGAVERDLIPRNPARGRNVVCVSRVPHGRTSTRLSRSMRCSELPARLTATRGRNMFTAGRYWRRLPSLVYGSGSCAHCAGVTWTSSLAG